MSGVVSAMTITLAVARRFTDADVPLEVLYCVVQVNAVLLEKGMHFDPRFKPQQAANLLF